ncbi:hypothetical protein DPEC_G00174090 [Dallia pectoralis]|uniref:Uncharacterized protein n=1 Tax=Dallia pectoralis TaxID=75939 RepID=A0ACC2GDT3_DALPE|nr:hypothetical protein DPEC_G00174090 [Dallia pectoralis]
MTTRPSFVTRVFHQAEANIPLMTASLTLRPLSLNSRGTGRAPLSRSLSTLKWSRVSHSVDVKLENVYLSETESTFVRRSPDPSESCSSAVCRAVLRLAPPAARGPVHALELHADRPAAPAIPADDDCRRIARAQQRRLGGRNAATSSYAFRL